MFREMRRIKQQVSSEECVRILDSERRGVLSVLGDDGYPYAIPVNFYYSAEDGKIWIHGAKEGHKIDAIRKCDKVCFTVWDQGYLKEGDWAYWVTCVTILGRAELVEDSELCCQRLWKLGAKYFPSEEDVGDTMKRSFDRVQMIAVTPEHMTGKLVHEK